MDRAFRFSLKAALVLCIAAGAALIVYSAVGPGVRPRPTNGRREQATAEAPGQQEPAAPAATPDAPAPPEEDQGEQEDDEGPFTIYDWELPLMDTQSGRKEADIRGSKAVRTEEGLYQVVKPIASILSAAEQQGLDVKLGTIRITADKATVNKSGGEVRLFDNVRARGEDFEIRAEEVLYNVADRTLTSDSPVQIRTEQEPEEGGEAPRMIINGTGLSVNVTLRKMSIRSDVTTRLHQVSRTFLAAGPEDGGGSTQPGDVVISCSGEMVYEHGAQKVVFHRNVEAAYQGRDLRCEELTVMLNGAADSAMEVNRILANGDVELVYEDQVARGKSLDWHNVIQSGTLTGDPASVQTSEFEITGSELTFYQMNNRFDAKGAGELFRHGTPPAAAGEEPEEEAAAPISLSRDAPLRIAWTDSMTYDLPGRFAGFTGGVRVRQRENQLKCDELKINFAEESGDIASVQATGNVEVVDTGGAGADGGREVRCSQFAWDAQEGRVELTAPEGDSVEITQDGQHITSSHVVFDQTANTLECPAAGRLARPAAEGDHGGAVDVRWDQSMRYEQGESPVATFRGDVLAVSGGDSIQTEALRVEFNAENDPVRIVAEGDTTIDVRSDGGALAGTGPGAPSEVDEGDAPQADAWRLRCEAVTIEPQKEMIRSETPGSLILLQDQGSAGNIAWQGAMQLDSTANRAVFRKGITAEVSGVTLNCDELKMDFNDAGELRHARADGDVRFIDSGPDAWRLESASAEAVFASGGELRQFIAREAVELSDRHNTVNCERLTLFLDEVPGEQGPSIRRAVAERDVVVVHEADDDRLEGTGDRLTWDRETDTYVLTGDPRAHVRRAGLETSPKRFVFHRTTGEPVPGNGD
jgi:lipopolysaccharide export system protein LptA